MSTKNFLCYGDAETLLAELEVKLKEKEDHPIEITWDAWNALSSAQRAGKHYIITDVPDATGSLDCDLMDLLWTNPNPSAEFGAQDVSVNLSNYDFVLMDTILYGTNESFTSICRTPKGGTAVRSRFINAWWSGSAVQNQQRDYTVYDNKITFTGGQRSGASYNGDLVPYHIYGIKRSLSFDFSAIAHDVKTDAANCMLSDGETSVEDMVQVGRKRVNFTSSSSRTIHGYLDIPQQCVAIIGWKVVFANANPSETFICLENSANTYNFIAYSQYAGCNATWWNDTNSTIRVYVGATYSGAASNYGDITYTFIKKVPGG